MKSLENLFAGVFILFLVIGSIVMFKVSGKINIIYLLGFFAVYKVLFITPVYVKKYLNLNGYDTSWVSAFLPYYNESMIMSSALSIIYIVALVALFVEVLALVIPSAVTKFVVGSGLTGATDWYVLVIRTLITTYAVMSIIRGIAYIKIFIDVEEIKAELNDIRPRYSIVFFFSALFALIPIIRVFALTVQYESLRKAVSSLYLADMDNSSGCDQYDWNNY